MALVSIPKAGQITSAIRANSLPDAIVKGYGTKAIQRIVENLAGGAIPNTSFQLPVVGVSVGLLDLARYVLLAGGFKLSIPAIVGTLVPLLFPNPTGYTAARNVPAPGYTNAYGG